MSSAVAALPPAKSPKKRSKSPRKRASLTVSDRILRAVSASKERGGVSLVALKKALGLGGYDVLRNKVRLLIAIRRLVASKALVHTKGTGASGSFRLNKKPPTPRKKGAVRKKPRAKKVKRASVGGSPAAKKSPKKRRKAKSPKKAKRAAAAKKPKKPQSPRKAKRRVTKPARTRAAAKK